MDKWIKLNVGGQQFVTSKSTLEKEPESMICRLVCGEIPSLKDENGAILIDRSPKHFDTILNYLRMGDILLDHDLNIEALIQEANFYGIMSLVKKCQTEYRHNLALIIHFEGNAQTIEKHLANSKNLVEELTKLFAQFGNVRRVVLRKMKYSSIYLYKQRLNVEVAFAKKEDVFKAKMWCEPNCDWKLLSDSSIVFCEMCIYSVEIYDFQLEKRL